MVRARVKVARNFDRNLDQIAAYLGAGSPAFDGMLGQLFDTVILNLERFPRLGIDLLARPTRSTETRAIKQRLLRLVATGWEVREYISDEYLILYLLRESILHLLSIRHHRQLSFDLAGHWEPPKR